MRKSIAALLASFMLTGCLGSLSGGGDDTPPRRFLELESIQFTMAPAVNDNWPVRVDLVRVKEADLVSELLRIETGTWFSGRRTAFRSTNPDALIDSWEVVPGTVVGPFEAEVGDDVEGVLFCELRSPPPPLRFDRDGEVVVKIEDDSCLLTGGEPSKEKGVLGNVFDGLGSMFGKVVDTVSDLMP